MGYPAPTIGSGNTGTTNHLAVPYTLSEAYQVLINAANSGAGLVRLRTQAFNAPELAAMALVIADATHIGEANGVLFNLKLGIDTLAYDTHWSALHTAIDAS